MKDTRSMVDKAARKQYTLEQALQQNADYFGFDVCDRIEIDGEIFEIRYREMLDAPTRERVNGVYALYNTCDRERFDISDGKGNKTTIQGGFKEPRERDGHRFDLDEQLSRAVWGDEKYERWIKAGGPPGLIQIVWTRMRNQFSKRLNDDSKSS